MPNEDTPNEVSDVPERGEDGVALREGVKIGQRGALHWTREKVRELQRRELAGSDKAAAYDAVIGLISQAIATGAELARADDAVSEESRSRRVEGVLRAVETALRDAQSGVDAARWHLGRDA